MNKKAFLPDLALTNLKKNAGIYIPYILTCIFSVFVFFIFFSISNNEMMYSLPHAAYVIALMYVGTALLGIVLFPFLFYTNSFLIKRRKKELGLYSILGMEKKHIARIITYETLLIFLISVVLGLLSGLVFSRLVFLFLLNITGLPITTEFNPPLSCYKTTIIVFAVIFFLNLCSNLLQVSTANPIELLRSESQGEKKPKPVMIAIMTIIGIITLWLGYDTALKLKLNSAIFLGAFVAILLVIAGTYFLFTSGSIAFLNQLKGIKIFYYKASNFITISDMLYRMKKNAASLVNICIFSTMVLVTLTCTVSLYLGNNNIITFQYPYDVNICFNKSELSHENNFEDVISAAAQNNNITITDKFSYTYQKISVAKKDNAYVKNDGSFPYRDCYSFRLISLEDYNIMEGKTETLADNEVLLYSTGENFNLSEIIIENDCYKVKNELQAMKFENKAISLMDSNNYVIVKSPELLDKYATLFEKTAATDRIYSVTFNLSGNEADKTNFLDQLWNESSNMQGLNTMNNIYDCEEETAAMNGGFLFLGIFFGIIFTICLILIMYYKQVTEGFEDKDRFNILQKVGMSNDDVKMTVKKQIMLVFFIPIIGAVLHTAVALKMIISFLGILYLFNSNLIIMSAIFVIIMFTIFYIVSYAVTAKTYFKIVSTKH